MNDGGPAFPTAFDAQGWQGCGISVRDYFAAHAPEHPWGHFEPVLLPRPAAPSSQPVGNDGQYPSELEARNLDEWRRDAHWDIDHDLPHFSRWVHEWHTYWEALRQWENDCTAARREQWPWFYADAMLKARGKHGS